MKTFGSSLHGTDNMKYGGKRLVVYLRSSLLTYVGMLLKCDNA